jgi:DnaJ family protein C protein 10
MNTPDMFEKLLKSKNVWLIDYFTPWCGHCQNFAPEFEIIAKKLKSVRAGKINCQNLPHICNKAGVNAYPTIRLYLGTESGEMQDPEGMEVNGYTYESISNYVEHTLSHFKQNREMPRDEL